MHSRIVGDALTYAFGHCGLHWHMHSRIVRAHLGRTTGDTTRCSRVRSALRATSSMTQSGESARHLRPRARPEMHLRREADAGYAYRLCRIQEMQLGLEGGYRNDLQKQPEKGGEGDQGNAYLHDTGSGYYGIQEMLICRIPEMHIHWIRETYMRTHSDLSAGRPATRRSASLDTCARTFGNA